MKKPKLGDKFNDWTVIGEPYLKGKAWYISCNCKCLTKKDVYIHNLYQNKSKGCMSCHGKKLMNDLKGKTFGRLFVINFIKTGKVPHEKIMWQCKCTCGSIGNYNAYELISGKIYRCRKCFLVSIRKSKISQYYGKIQRGAKYRGIVFSITLEDIEKQWQLQNGICSLTGREISEKHFTYGSCKDTNVDASLDRIDSSKGYEIGNIQWVHKDINFAKVQLSQKDFIKMCEEVVDFQKTKNNA